MKAALVITELSDWTEGPQQIVWAPPLGLAYIAAYALKYAKVPSLDVRIFRNVDQIMDYKPDLVGISSMTCGFRKVEELAARIKEECPVPIAVGGQHITALPENLPEHCDIGVLGEGEETFKEIIEAAESGMPDPSVLGKIPGLAYRENGRVVTTRTRPFIEDLDRIPFPARYLFDGYDFKEPAVRILTSRGCPYPCRFCSVTLCRGRKVRYHSPEYVLREIEYIRETQDVPRLKIEDDVFTLDRERVDRIRDLLDRRGLIGEFLMNGYSRSDIIDPEWCRLLRSMAFDVVQLGLESMSENVLEFLGKDGITPETNRRAVDLIYDHEMATSGVFMIGVPGETRNDILKIHDFLMYNYHKFSIAAAVRLRVYPGTPLWDYAIDSGFTREELLEGVMLDDGEDTYGHERTHILGRYPYLNEASIPREEFAYYTDFFGTIAIVSQENWRRVVRMREAEAEVGRLGEENARLLAERAERDGGHRVVRAIRRAAKSIRGLGRS